MKQIPQRPLRRAAGILFLTLHREYFDAIVSGKKKVEYRQDKAFWRQRLLGKTFSEIHFRNGYNPKNAFMRVKFKGIGKQRLGGRIYFAIRLGKILELKNYRK